MSELSGAVTIKIGCNARETGQAETEAVWQEGGLAVTAGVGTAVGLWGITHMASGWLLGGYWTSKGFAISRARSIRRLAEWTQPLDAILALSTETRQKIARRLYSKGSNVVPL